jgi:hypothetical protein
VRLATTKYVKTGICKTVSEAVEKIFTDHLDKFFETFDSNQFRKEKLWQEECDRVLKRSMHVIKTVYGRYSGKDAMPGNPKYMSL